jgi:hypothetical protein
VSAASQRGFSRVALPVFFSDGAIQIMGAGLGCMAARRARRVTLSAASLDLLSRAMPAE